MTNSKNLKQEFIEYTRNCILSRRPSDKSEFTIGRTAADSYVSFVEVDKLFSYNPEKWKDIKSIFDIDSSEKIKEIYLELVGDKEFNKVDCLQASQYFRSNALKHYYCFLKAREVVLGKTGSQHGVVDDSPEFCQRNDKQSLQQIFYGAPGTGKSHAVKTETEAWEKRGRVVRTTFHPDSDYSTFVGTYKPTTESVQRYDIYNKPMTRDGVPVMEQIITYEFVEQAFLQAYIDAWKNREEPEFLIIEEINRGNCAQIFGDLFQLLDRGNDGCSEYAIRADKDLQKHLCKAFEDVEIADYPNVKAGKELLLPGNLYIRATMNTSDQSLFPIDSAFKRRWDWKYVPIAKGNENGTELNWMIEVDGDLYDWWTFVTTINKHVFETTNSEDKQLGFFFCKAKANIISAETFVCKVIFYLWNDVFKDFGFDDKIFEDNEDNENPKLSFDKFYLANGTVNEGKVRMFLDNLGMMPKESTEGNSNIVDPKTKIEVNGRTVRFINAIPYMAVEEYVHLNPGKTAQEVVGVWDQFKNCSMRTWIVCNKQDHDAMKPQYANYSHEIKCADGQSLWVNKDGWMHHPQNPNLRDTIAEFIKAVNDAELGVAITETTL
ncbi:MAG: AAA family ATPase [Bacteroidales bacterium]|nr:AAA family ATPase [Bacteroidales bacterium]